MRSSKRWWLRRITDVERYRSVREAEAIPWGYGFVSYNPCNRSMLVAPIPLNWVLYWIRGSWLRLQKGAQRQELHWAYDLGYQDGRAHQKREGLMAQLLELAKKGPIQ